MKYIKLFFLLLICMSCQSQDKSLLLETRLISDLSKMSVYSRMTETINDKIQWKEAFQYIDSIEIYSITYLSDGLKVKGLLVKPKRKGKFPCVIYNRGGNRDFGSLKIATGARRLGKIASEGYIVIASQYRGNADGEGQEEFGGSDVNDVINLIEILKEVEGADVENIGMYGWSRGGMMTYIALTKTNKIKAAVVGGARSDMTIIDRPKMESMVYSELIPNYFENKEEELKKRSAIFWVDKFPKDVPILLLHGNSDWRVKSTNSLRLALEFEKFRIPYRLKIFEGGDHSISEFRNEVHDDVVEWFDRYLKKGEALPDMEFHGR